MRNKRKTERKKEKKNEWYSPAAANAAPEPQALSLLHTATLFGRELPDLSGRQEVHHRLVALFYGKKLSGARWKSMEVHGRVKTCV